MEKIFNKINHICKNKILLDRMIMIFTFCVMMYQTLYLIIPVRQFFYLTKFNYFSYLLAVCGLCLFFWDLICDRYFLKTKYSYILIVLIVVMCVSSLINYEYGFVSNIKSVIWQISQILVIFPLYKRVSKDSLLSLLKKFYIVASVFYIPSIIISFYQLFARISYIAVCDGGYSRQGFTEGRLFGIFSSPHFTALVMSVLTIISIYYTIKVKKRLSKISYFCCAIIYLFHITASGSRSAVVALVCAIFFIAVLLFAKFFKNKSIKLFLRSTLSVALAVVFSLVSICTFSLAKKGIDLANVGINFVRNGFSNEYNTSFNDDESSEENDMHITDEELDILNRSDTDISNISNNRFDIWNEYLTITAKDFKSLLFGYSLGSYMLYIIDNYPDSFIVSNIRENHPDMFSKNSIYDTHNAYIGAFVTTGLVGIILLFTFLIMGLVNILKALIKSKKIVLEIYVFLGVLVFILVASFFDSDLFFRCTSTSILFWYFSGLTLKFAEAE